MNALLLKHTYKGKFVRAYRITRQKISIGSAQNTFIHLIGGKAAGLSCLIYKEKNQWKIIDLGSEPDTKINHKTFVEHDIDSHCTLTICENTIEITPMEKYRNVFPAKFAGADSGANFYVAKWKGGIIASGFEKSAISSFPKDMIQLQEFKFGRKKEIEKEAIQFQKI